jgi:hypothetical protein
MYQTMIVEAKEVVAGVVDGASKGVVHSHTDIIIWIYAAAINVFIVILWWVVKRWVNNIDTWRGDAAKGGGFMTRDQYFEWCKPQQAKCRDGFDCRIDDVEQWRDSIMEKGGALSFQDHMAICDRLSEKNAANFAKRTDELMMHHRELVETQFTAFMERIEKRIVESFAEIRKEFNRNHNK